MVNEVGNDSEYELTGERRTPWEEAGLELKDAERLELILFQKHEPVRQEYERRLEDFDARQRRERLLFKTRESAKYENMYHGFQQRVFSQGIDQTRQQSVPAYTFTKFAQLPLEIQIRIWSMASRASEPRTYSLFCLDCNGGGCTTGANIPTKPIPSVLHICRNSRAEALKVYSRLPQRAYTTMCNYTWINTLYNQFYMGIHRWSKFKVLIHTLIKMHTTRPYDASLCYALEAWQNIRLLTVDLNVFGEAPARIWAEAFPRLEALTIAFYPRPTLKTFDFADGGVECGDGDRDLTFVCPQKGTKYGKRADWIASSVYKALVPVKKDLPGWEIPRIEVVALMTDIDEDYNVVEALTDEEVSEDEEDSDCDDSIWYKEAEARMSFPTDPMALIKRFKRVYHPSRRVKANDIYSGTLKHEPGTYYTDSEHEGGTWDSEESDEEDSEFSGD